MHISGDFNDVICACKFGKKLYYSTQENLNLVCEVNRNQLKILTTKYGKIISLTVYLPLHPGKEDVLLHKNNFFKQH